MSAAGKWPGVLAAIVAEIRAHYGHDLPVGNGAIPVDAEGRPYQAPFFVVDPISDARFAGQGHDPQGSQWEYLVQIRSVGERRDQAGLLAGWIDDGVMSGTHRLIGAGWYEIGRVRADSAVPPPDGTSGVVSFASRYTFAIGSS